MRPLRRYLSSICFLPVDEIKSYLSTVKLKPLTKKTGTSLKALKEELEAIRAGAFAYSYEELNEGMIAIGSPVFDLTGHVKASMVVPVPTIRYNARKEKNIERVLREASSRLSHQLGYEDRL